MKKEAKTEKSKNRTKPKRSYQAYVGKKTIDFNITFNSKLL